MLFRVLCSLLLCSTVASPASAAVRHPDEVLDAEAVAAAAPRRAALAESLYAERSNGRSPFADPMDDSRGHAMWDALGSGCVDGGDWTDPFPAGKGDIRSPAFCVPQPCARQLTEEELARNVLGRPLREREWETYLARYADHCLAAAGWPGLPLAEIAPLLASLSGLGDWIAGLEWTQVAYGQPEVVDAGDPLPILSPPPPDGPVSRITRPTRRDDRPSRGTPYVTSPPGPEKPPSRRPPSPQERPPAPPPIPLPPAFLLLPASLGALVALRRSRRAQSRSIK